MPRTADAASGKESDVFGGMTVETFTDFTEYPPTCFDTAPDRIRLSKVAALTGSLSSMNTSTITLPARREVI
jgi:hypothetical protein